MKRVAIMQPTYLPWIGYFGLMDQVDEFVFLDSVQFAKRSWQQRNQIKTPNGPAWLSIPVQSKGARGQKIYQVPLIKDGTFPAKHIRSIEMAYSKSAYYSEYADDLFGLMLQNVDCLSDMTITLILWFKKCLGITTPCIKATELNSVGTKADLLSDLCHQVHGEHYISPLGSKDYMEQSDAFDKKGIEVSYFHYAHPEYAQQGVDFVPYMSVIDLLFNAGPNSLGIIRSGYEVRKK